MGKTRNERWAEGIGVRYSGSDGFQCTHRGCKNTNLRLSDDGVWCADHYKTYPRCSNCGEDRPSIPTEYTGGKRICRDCWQDTFDNLAIPILSKIMERREVVTDAADITFTDAERKRKPEFVRGKTDNEFPGECRDTPRGRVHVFASGGLRCQCGHHGGANRNRRRYNRNYRTNTPTPA